MSAIELRDLLVKKGAGGIQRKSDKLTVSTHNLVNPNEPKPKREGDKPVASTHGLVKPKTEMTRDELAKAKDKFVRSARGPVDEQGIVTSLNFPAEGSNRIGSNSGGLKTEEAGGEEKGRKGKKRKGKKDVGHAVSA